jgi:hypothetical protein
MNWIWLLPLITAQCVAGAYLCVKINEAPLPMCSAVAVALGSAFQQRSTDLPALNRMRQAALRIVEQSCRIVSNCLVLTAVMERIRGCAMEVNESLMPAKTIGKETLKCSGCFSDRLDVVNETPGSPDGTVRYGSSRSRIGRC